MPEDRATSDFRAPRRGRAELIHDQMLEDAQHFREEMELRMTDCEEILKRFRSSSDLNAAGLETHLEKMSRIFETFEKRFSSWVDRHLTTWRWGSALLALAGGVIGGIVGSIIGLAVASHLG